MAQHFPPDNSPRRGISWAGSYLDDVLGIVVPGDFIRRDLYNRRRRLDDLDDEDTESQRRPIFSTPDPPLT